MSSPYTLFGRLYVSIHIYDPALHFIFLLRPKSTVFILLRLQLEVVKTRLPASPVCLCFQGPLTLF